MEYSETLNDFVEAWHCWEFQEKCSWAKEAMTRDLECLIFQLTGKTVSRDFNWRKAVNSAVLNGVQPSTAQEIQAREDERKTRK